MLDGFFFASPYAARMRDGIALYRRYYEVCNLFGADKLVFHGDYAQNVGHLSLEEYAANFRALAEVGRGYGVALLHENMFYCRLKTPEDVRHLRALMGEIAAFVLDTKAGAARGAGQPARNGKRDGRGHPARAHQRLHGRKGLCVARPWKV